MKKVFVYLLMILLASGVWAQVSQLSGSTGVGGGTSGAAIQATMQAAGATSQPASLSYEVPEPQSRAMLAMATPDYPVTIGDIYTLSFMRSYQQESISLMVEGDGSINVSFFGRIQTSGMSFRALKELLEKKVAAAYPGSSPSLVIVSTGLFPVKMQGEVVSSKILTAWGLTRLSELVKVLATSYSSARNVSVLSADGVQKAYDLFKAERKGDLTQDPYLRPGDVVEVKRAERIVTLEGEVRRPGKYQLLSGEGVKELVSYYGDGALESAKTDLTVVTRKATAEKPESESVVFDLGEKSLPDLYDGDVVRVASREEYLPVVYVEGAVKGAEVGVKETAQAGNADTVVSEQYRTVRLVYRQGQLLSQALRSMRDQLDPRADLKRAFITRKGETKPLYVDLEKLLYRYVATDDLVLKAEDRVVIPYGSMYVFVTGEVTKSSWVGITGLTRLSEAMKPLVTSYSSLREVKVASEDGTATTYDLFKAERLGDLSQDPYLRPGDVVEVKRAERIVTLGGEVRRPGKYQLLSGEGVKELVSYYGDGALESAKTDLTVVTRKATAEKPESESVVFDLGEKSLPDLYDGDVVRVASREEYLPVVYLEGAFVVEQTGATTKTTTQQAGSEVQVGTTQEVQAEAYALVRVPFRKGQLVSQVVRSQKEKLSDKADLRNAYIARGSVRIAVNLEKLLYAYDAKYDIELTAEDRVIIPFGQDYAYVRGEVTKASWVDVTSTTRLSEALKDNLTQMASTRDVEIRSIDGAVTNYDLFKAERLGDLTQDPYVRPGDVVEVKRAERIVTLEGEVRRPGKYQLVVGEGVSDLVAFYGNGVLESAKTELVVVTRKATGKDPEGEMLVVDLGSKALPELRDGDVVRVPSREEYLPVVYIEGAIGETTATNAVLQGTNAPAQGIIGIAPKSDQTGGTSQPPAIAANASPIASTTAAGQQAGANPSTFPIISADTQTTQTATQAADAYGFTRIIFRKGMTLSLALKPIAGNISPKANLRNAYIARNGERIPINLEKLLYAYEPRYDVVLQADDRVLIPFGQDYAYIKGEVTASSWIAVTSATRLSEALNRKLTNLSSTRDIVVTSIDGAVNTYDLFKAERKGDISQDPYLLPGDEVQVQRLKRVVTISGEVRRPGTYQLLAGESLEDLINVYADGFTEKANPGRMTVTRYVSSISPVGEKIQLDYSKTPNFEINLYDAITVPPYQELLPVAWFEGAVGVGVEGTAPQAAQRIAYTFFPGDTVSQAALANRKLFSEVSDLANSYVLRKGSARIPVDLTRFLYDRNTNGDVVLEPNDVIIVPFRQFFVTVSGAVKAPGRYPYVPDRTWEYYVGLAGGLDTERNSGKKLDIYDVNSRVQPKNRIIQPEDNIVAAANSFTYNFYRISSILSTIIAVASLIIALLP